VIGNRLENLENLQELVQALEGAIQTETGTCCSLLSLFLFFAMADAVSVSDARIASDNEVMDLLVAMKRSVYEQLAQKSNVEVRAVSFCYFVVVLSAGGRMFVAHSGSRLTRPICLLR
jgi:hypothetical protein